MQLIGYPHAGQPWRKPSDCRVSTKQTVGVITNTLDKGTGTGHGFKLHGLGRVGILAKRGAVRGQALGKRARGTGTGLDADMQQANALESWLCPLHPNTDAQDTAALPGIIDHSLAAQRARILSEIASEHDLASRLHAIGQRAARRQARRLVELRGVKPSETSVQDAAQDAIVGILEHVRKVDKATAAQWATMRFVRVLALYAGRAAFNSLCSWSRLGVTGDNTGAGTASNWCEFVTDALDTISGDAYNVSTDTWVPQVAHSLAESRARRAVVRWVFNIGLREFAANLPADMRGTARASAVAGARRRCRVVGSILFGATLADAVFHAGFTSSEAFQNSCKSASFWTSLKQARRATLGEVPSIATARGWQHAWALDAKQASLDLLALGSSGAYADTLDTTTLRAISLRGIKSTARVFNRRAVLDTLRESVQWSQYYKTLAAKLTRDNLRAFDRIADGLMSGKFADLDKATIGKRHKGVQSALISRARGKVTTPKVLAPTVPVKVQTRFGERKLHCAPSMGLQPWATIGQAGFTVCNP